MFNRKNMVLLILLISVILTTIIVGSDCVIIKDYRLNPNNTKNVNLYPLYDIFSTFRDDPMMGIKLLLRNIIVGLTVGLVICIILNLLKVEDKYVKVYAFLTVCYLSEIILFSIAKNGTTFSVDSVILRYIGCLFGDLIVSKFKLRQAKNYIS